MFRVLLGTVLAVSWLGPPAAQVVLLPEYQQFRYQGGVMVPDGGTAILGGVSRAAQGSSRRWGGLGGRSFGQSFSTGQATVRATIIDHQAIDRRLLGGTPETFLRRQRPFEASNLADQAAVPRGLGERSESKDGEAKPGDAVASGDAVAVADARQERGKAYVRLGRQMYRMGERRQGEMAYRRAVSLLDGPLRALAISEARRQQQRPR